MAILDVSLAHPLRAFTLELSLEVGRETVALVGPSGAGKTSVLRAIAGLLTPERGAVCVGGTSWFCSARGVDLAPEARSVGLVFQEYALFPHRSVRRNVAFGASAGLDLDALLARFRIDHLAHERPGSL